MRSPLGIRCTLSDRSFHLFLAFAAFLLIIGTTWLAAVRADQELRAGFFQQARLTAAALNPQQVAALKGDATDLASSEYQKIKEQLTRIRLSYPDCRFLYLMTRRPDNTIIINVDSEPAGSKDYSPPGQIYDEASAKLCRVFATGVGLVEGPLKDRWGTWISSYVPYSGRAGEAVKIIFGMDIDAKKWKWSVASRAAFPAALIAIAILLALLAMLLHRSRRKIRLRERQLKKSEEELRCIYKATPIGLSILKDHVIQSVNKAWCDNFGYTESEIIGRTPHIIFETEAEHERVQNQLDHQFTESNMASVQTRHVRKDGTLRDVVLTVAPLQSESKLFETVVATNDITDLIEKEKALHDSYKHLADIIDFLPDATFVIDRNSQVLTWNRAMEVLTGIKKEDMIGKADYEYSLPFYGDRRPILIDLALRPDLGKERNYEVLQRRNDVLCGDCFAPNLPPGDVQLSATAAVLRNDAGEIVAAIECIRNNTDQRKLEERLKQAEKMETLGTLAGGVAHDLNNVLGIMAGYSELLRDMTPDGPQKKYATHIFNSSVKAAAIIDDLLTLARRGVRISKIVNLNDVLSDYLKSPVFEKLRSDHPDVKFVIDVEKGLLNLKGSSVHLGKVIMNLVSNAAESIIGPGEIVIRTENRSLDKPIQGCDELKEGDYTVLTVSDTGSGIPEKELVKIFEPFYSRKEMGKSGTGLGLAVVWGTVRDHHGYIDVQSREGTGTRFELYFPVSRKEPDKSEKNLPLEECMGKGESLLVVDDVREQRELAVSILEKLHYQVDAVAGGEEAIEYMKVKKASLVILDMTMEPGMDGLETYRRILEIHPGQKAIIVSGFSQTDRVKKAQELGAGAYVRKPYILERIGSAVRKELDRNMAECG